MGRRILAITDQPADAGDGLQALRESGYDIQRCADLEAGLQTLAAGHYGVILLLPNGLHAKPLEWLEQVKAADSATPIVILSRQATVAEAVAAMRAGAADFLRDPCSADELQSALRHAAESAAHSPGPVSAAAPGQRTNFEGLLAQCAAMREVFALIERIAPADSTVLVFGESGTGKEMVGRAIHRHSRRRDGPFLACDCTALAPTLLESELFGHVKGSFSGAIASKMGLFEVAHHGTLMLDELANLSMETQGKLLRVLETRRVRKVGDTAENEVDIRLIATTNRNLAEMVKVGEFRADLYYRLNVVPITLPPLRDRPGDIPLLAETFLEHFSQPDGPACPRLLERSHTPNGGLSLAGKRPGIAEHRRTVGGALRWVAHRVGAPASRSPRGQACGFRCRSAADLGRAETVETASHRGPGTAIPDGGPRPLRPERHPGGRDGRDAADEFPRPASPTRVEAPRPTRQVLTLSRSLAAAPGRFRRHRGQHASARRVGRLTSDRSGRSVPSDRSGEPSDPATAAASPPPASQAIRRSGAV